MNKLTKVIIKPLQRVKYLKPLCVDYILNGKRKTWATLDVHQGTSILLFNSTRKVMIFVKQFRPVIYLNKIPEEDRIGIIDAIKYPAELGITIELCAGIVDKNKPIELIAVEEIEEECNYKVSPSALEKIICYRSEVSRQGTVQTLFYCEVTDEMKKNSIKLEEEIDTVEMTIPEAKKFISQKDCSTTAILLYAIQWFLINKYKNNYLAV